MELKPGMKVKLVPWEQADNEHPNINQDMKPLFGRIVTIKDIKFHEKGLFHIKEDNEHIYHTRWIEPYNFVPDELFEI